MYKFGAGQENRGCKCTHCTHKFGAIDYINSDLNTHTKLYSCKKLHYILVKIEIFSKASESRSKSGFGPHVDRLYNNQKYTNSSQCSSPWFKPPS